MLRPNKKITVLRVARPYLNLLVKPRFFSSFVEKNIFFLCILKGKCLSKSIKLYPFFQKKKYVCLIFRPVARNTLIFFIWPYLLFGSSIVSGDSVDSKPYGDGPGLSDSVDAKPFKGGTSRGGGG